MNFYPLISVLIPTYNRLVFLEEAIKSVLAQDYVNFELIITNDGSTDETKNYLDKLQDSRITLIHSENRGVSAARNLGIKKSKGEYIALLDSDDTWKKNKLSAQVEFLNEYPEIKILQTEEIWIRNGQRVNSMVKHKKKEGWIFKECLPLCRITPSAVLMKKEIFDKIGLFDETMPVCEDYDLWLRITPFYQVGLIKLPLVTKYGGHEDQLSRKFWGMDAFRLYALEKAIKNPSIPMELKTSALSEAEKKVKILIAGFSKRGNLDEKLKFEFKIEELRKIVEKA